MDIWCYFTKSLLVFLKDISPKINSMTWLEFDSYLHMNLSSAR